MSDLSPEARALLDAARQATIPTLEDRARVLAALATALAAPPAPLPTRSPGALPVVAGVAALLAIVGALGLLLRPAAPGPAPTPATPIEAPPPPVPPAPIVAPAVPAPTPEPVEPRPPIVIVQPRPAAPKPLRFDQPLDLADPPVAPEPGSTLAEELRLLQSAQAALGSEPARALELLAEHERRFPRGALREERIATRVGALCAAGQADAGRAEAERFLAENPDSPYTGRVRAACR